MLGTVRAQLPEELMMLDFELDSSTMQAVQRQDLLFACWHGPIDHADFDNTHLSLARLSITHRLPFLSALHCVMSTWCGDKPVELVDPFPKNSTVHNYVVVLEHVEHALALFYMTSFFYIFWACSIYSSSTPSSANSLDSI